MVKRAIAIVVGAAAGAGLWFLFAAVRAEQSEADPSMEACMKDGFVECVGYVTPQQAPPAIKTPSPVAEPCKGWLSATSEGSMALLSQCLHQARSERDAQRLEQIMRARAVAASS